MNNKVILVILNGHAGVGKDTFVKLCIKNSKNIYPCNILNYHRSDRAKTAMRVLGWDEEKTDFTRQMMKNMVDYMEYIGTLNRDLFQQIEICSMRDTDQIIFYHVRDPEKIQNLLKLCEEKGVKALSVLIKRDTPEQEPLWWDDLEKAEYDMTIQLPPDNIEKTEELAGTFMSYLSHM